MRTGLRAAVGVALDCGFAVIEEGAEPSLLVPPALLTQAGLAARRELCVYASLEQGASEFKRGVAGIAPIGNADYASAGASTTGALLKFAVLAEGVFAFGTFAVTG